MAAISYPRDGVERLHREMQEDHLPAGSGARAVENRLGNDIHAPIPSREHLDELLSVAFIASLKTEEVRASTFTLAYISREGLASGRHTVVEFARPRELTAANVTKIAAGTDPYSTSVCVSPREGRLMIWGLAHAPVRPLSLGSKRTTVNREHGFLLIRTPSPGVLYAYYHVRLQMLYAHGSLQFELEHGRLTQIFRDHALADNGEVIAQIVTRIREHGRGGTILLTDPGAAAPPAGLDLSYAFAEPSLVLKDAVAAFERSGGEHQVQERTEAAIDFIAELSQVDGAVHLGSDLTMYGYGGNIQIPAADSLNLLIEDPETGVVSEGTEADLPGMRHRSAASFCSLQAGQALAVVVSQDGDVSFFGREASGRVRKIGPFVLGTSITLT
jgi:hypothetical protein